MKHTTWAALAALLLTLLLAGAIAADKPAAPQLSDKSKLALREAQHNSDQLELRAASLQAQVQQLFQQLQEQKTAAGKALEEARAAAYKEAGVSSADYDLDLEKLVFTAKPRPPAPPPQQKK